MEDILLLQRYEQYDLISFPYQTFSCISTYTYTYLASFFLIHFLNEYESRHLRKLEICIIFNSKWFRTDKNEKHVRTAGDNETGNYY